MGLASKGDDFSEESGQIDVKKKRKRQSDDKNGGKRVKTETKAMKSPNGATIKDFFFSTSPKTAKKMKTLDEHFAKCPKKKETEGKGVVEDVVTTPKQSKMPIVDLTSPELIPKATKRKLKRDADDSPSPRTVSEQIDLTSSNQNVSEKTDAEPPSIVDHKQDKSFCTSYEGTKVSKDKKKRQKNVAENHQPMKVAMKTTPINSSKNERRNERTERQRKKQDDKGTEKVGEGPSHEDRVPKNFLHDIAKKMGDPTKSVGAKTPATKTSKVKSSRKRIRVKITNKKKPKANVRKVSDKMDVKSTENSTPGELSDPDPENELKHRKSSSEGVVFVAEVKKAVKPKATPSKRNQSLRQDKINKDKAAADKTQDDKATASMPQESLLWTEKYSPKKSDEIVGNAASVSKLVAWLKDWRQRWEKEQNDIINSANAKSRKANDGDDSDSDFELDSNDIKTLSEEHDTFPKAGVIIGPAGCGKTSAAFACAQELGFKVFEMNSSSQRSSRQILSQLHEATQSHQVSKTSKNMNFFIVKENSKKLDGNSLILFEDVDVLFDDDKFFWSAVDTLIADTKRPIILTTSDSSVLSNLERRHEKFLFNPPSIDNQLSCLRSIAKNEGCDITEEDFHNVRMANRLLRCDLRRTIHALQFWADGIDVVGTGNSLSKTCTKNQTKKSRKRRRSTRLRRGKSQEAVEIPENTENTNSVPVLEEFFSKTCGILDTMSAAKKDICDLTNGTDDVRASSISTLFTLIQNCGSDEKKRIELTERIVSTMIAGDLPQIIKINWMDLLQVFGAPVRYSIGKKPLSILVPRWLSEPNSDIEFRYDVSSDEAMSPVLQQEQAVDFLMDEDFADVSYDVKSLLFSQEPSSPSPCVMSPASSSKKPTREMQEVPSSSAKDALGVRVLDVISMAADMCCLSDRLEYAVLKGQRSPLGGSWCKVKDGLLDCLHVGDELSDQNALIHCDIQAAIQVRSMGCCFNRLLDIPTRNVVPSELPLRLPHEGKMRKNHSYLTRSLQSKFLGGSFTTLRGFTVDYLPAIRSISRSENAREASKKKRRFLHYFNSIRVFPKPTEMSRLVNDFTEITEQS